MLARVRAMNSSQKAELVSARFTVQSDAGSLGAFSGAGAPAAAAPRGIKNNTGGITSKAVIAARPRYAGDQPQRSIINWVTGTSSTMPTPPPAQAMPSAVPLGKLAREDRHVRHHADQRDAGGAHDADPEIKLPERRHRRSEAEPDQ